jgi:hypothetical protein
MYRWATYSWPIGTFTTLATGPQRLAPERLGLL